MSLQLIYNMFITGSIYVLIAYSFSLIYSVSKFFHISHAIIISMGAYFTFFLVELFHLSLWIAVPGAILLSTFIGLLIESFIYKPLRRKLFSPLQMLLTSLGIYVVLQNCISLLWGDDKKSIVNNEIKVGHDLFGAYLTNIQFITIIVNISLFIGLLMFMKLHKLGKKIRAVSSNDELAKIQGINSDDVILLTVGLGSTLAAVAGILIASDTGLTPTMGFNLLLYGVVAMIIGGVNSNSGIIGGAILLAVVQNLTSYNINSKWMDAITYIILILFLLWKPLGFSGMRLKKIEI